ncbi:MAG: TolC family protein [Bacteroidota bacterium]
MHNQKPTCFGIAFLLIIIFLTPLKAQDFTLEECIKTAWENNLQLQQQRLSVDLAEQNLSQSKASLFPNLNASASNSYNFGRTVDPFTNDFVTESVRSNNFSISTGVNLFSGFQVQNTIRQNQLELEAGKFDLDRSFNDIALMVASAYLQILFNRELVENANNQLEVTRQQVERTQKLVDAGTLPRGSILTIQAQMATEELQLINAQNQLELSLLNLRQIMFVQDEDDFSIVVPEIEISSSDDVPGSPLEVYTVAVEQQPEIKSADLRIESAERGLAIAKGGRSPQVSMRASYGSGYSQAIKDFTQVPTGLNQVIRDNEGNEFLVPITLPEGGTKSFSDQMRDNLSRSLSFFLTIPIFNNYQTRAAVGRSRINLENSKLQSQIVREQLFQTIQQAHADAVAALKRYNATQKNVEALEESFRYSEQRFNVGMVNSVEYNDAKNRLAAAESELLQAKYEYIFRLKILEFYMGDPLNL